VLPDLVLSTIKVPSHSDARFLESRISLGSSAQNQLWVVTTAREIVHTLFVDAPRKFCCWKMLFTVRYFHSLQNGHYPLLTLLLFILRIDNGKIQHFFNTVSFIYQIKTLEDKAELTLFAIVFADFPLVSNLHGRQLVITRSGIVPAYL